MNSYYAAPKNCFYIIAAAAGGVFFGGLAIVGVPFDVLFVLTVIALFSPILVSLFTSVGSITDSRLKHNGRDVDLRQVTDIQSIHLDTVTVVLISYAKGTGFLAPRLLTIPDKQSNEVITRLERGIPLDPGTTYTEPLVRVVVGGAGLLFIGVAIVVVFSIDDTTLVMYFGGILGGIGLLLCIAGWRGV